MRKSELLYPPDVNNLPLMWPWMSLEEEEMPQESAGQSKLLPCYPPCIPEDSSGHSSLAGLEATESSLLARFLLKDGDAVGDSGGRSLSSRW